MGKILYIDLLSPSGHKTFNELTLNALKSEYEVFIVGRKNFIKNEEINLIIPEKFFHKSNKIKNRINEIKKIKWILLNLKDQNYDKVVFSSYETISFSIMSKKILNMGKKIMVFNHNNIDEIDKSIIKKFFYTKINKKIIHLVFEDYIKQFLINKKLKNNIKVIPHIVLKNKIENSDINEKDIQIFVPSLYHDTLYINRIIKNNNNNDYKLIIKSKNNYNDKNVESKAFFDDYERVFIKSNFILLPLTIDYNYRVSNIINESFSYGKIIFSYKNKLTQFIKKQYPNSIYIIDRNVSINDMIKIYKNVDKSKYQKEQKKYLTEHSKEKFLNAFKKI